MIYQFDYGKITYCAECPINDFANDKCNLTGKRTKCHSKPEENDCPLVAIPKTETTSCEWCEKVGKYAQFDFAIYTEVDGDKECEYAVKVNHCPNCGRKLKGE